MCDLHLERPTLSRKKDAILFVEEYFMNNENVIGSGYLDKYYHEYETWLNLLTIYENEKTCPKNVSPGYTFFLIKESTNKIVGITNIRTSCKNLNVYLHGGNIGYSIRPSERKKGYGKKILKLCLNKCKEMGIDNVIIVTSDDNFASRKIIESNYGKFISTIPSSEKKGHKDLRYNIIFN